jgi:hypothetical protein
MAPVYPYPNPYIPSEVEINVYEGGPASYYPTSSSYYYCDDPAGYYPYVPQCFTAWKQVTTSEPLAGNPIPAPAISQRDDDYRQLNAYADRFYHTDINNPGAREELKDLGKEVKTFRKTLVRKAYNTKDILKDTDDLKNRISAQQKELSQNKF